MSNTRYLIDTHILLWDLNDDSRLKERHFRLMTGEANKYISIVTIWEIAIKANIGKLTMPPGLLESIENSDISILSVLPEHALAVTHLPHHHRDPFDRMLVAQAQMENLTIMTMDKNLRLYDVEVI